MKGAWAAAALALSLAANAAAAPWPARSGERGILDVPDAEVSGIGGGLLGAELRLDRVSGEPTDFGPLPVYLVSGIFPTLDLGASVRESGQPGDPRPSRTIFGFSAKQQLWAPAGTLPGGALSLVLDRVNRGGVAGARLALSTGEISFLRLAAFVGGEAEVDGLGNAGPTAGLAATAALPRGMELAGEALAGPRGENLGLAVRWGAQSTLGVSLGVNYLPGDDAFRVALALAFRPKPKPIPVKVLEELKPKVEEEEEIVAAGFLDDRPHFRLRIRSAGVLALGEPRRLQHGPITVAAAAPAPARGPAAAPAAPARAAAPSLDDLAEAQLREQEALAEARERRVRSTGEQLDARGKGAGDDTRSAEARERELAAREQQLDARERRAPRLPPSQQQRQLESLEAQLAAQERQLAAQERSLVPAIDAAQGRERDAGTREEAERQEAARLAATASAAPSRTAQLDLRKQALGARNRQLAALEAQLVAKGERVDAVERQLRVRGERLDAWGRRLDTRTERLDLVERRELEQRPPAAPRPAEPKDARAPAPAAGKPAFVMVVKSPTAIVKERAGAPAGAAPGTALHAGVAVEKAVAAATVVVYPTPATQLSELDRETVDNIARLAARDRCELLIWARAKEPSLMAEAQRRADELRTRAIAVGPLAPAQVVTRITTRPGAQGVDVVVSALRETAKPAAPAPAAPAQAAPALLAGESGKRQIRDAVVAAQPSIEACVGEHLERRRLDRAEGVLRVTISTAGQATRVATGEGDLAGPDLEACLTKAAAGWTFPASDAEYVVDVPITIIRGGTR